MRNFYFKRDLDIARCNIFNIFLIYQVHRVASLFKTRYLFVYPRLKEIVMVFVAHKLFYVFHFLYNFRNFVKKLRDRVLGP